MIFHPLENRPVWSQVLRGSRCFLELYNNYYLYAGEAIGLGLGIIPRQSPGTYKENTDLALVSNQYRLFFSFSKPFVLYYIEQSKFKTFS
jgi:hypothetical protein